MRIDWLFWIEIAMFGLAWLLLSKTDATGLAVAIGVAAIGLEFVRRGLGIRDDFRAAKVLKASRNEGGTE
jgi:hypothetical protein